MRTSRTPEEAKPKGGGLNTPGCPHQQAAKQTRPRAVAHSIVDGSFPRKAPTPSHLPPPLHREAHLADVHSVSERMPIPHPDGRPTAFAWPAARSEPLRHMLANKLHRRSEGAHRHPRPSLGSHPPIQGRVPKARAWARGGGPPTGESIQPAPQILHPHGRDPLTRPPSVDSFNYDLKKKEFLTCAYFPS